MKTVFNRIALTGTLLALLSGPAWAQQDRSLQYFREKGQDGLNVFESPKENDVEFDGVKVRVGGAFALQFQGLSQENDANNLTELDNNFNLATANLDLDVQLADGVRMNLRTFLSSRHHTEAYVKGGYLQVDKLDFIKEGFLSDLMEKVTIKIGHMENNYGDAHFRRTDNGHAIYNPFVGNYLMDSYTTEVGAEVYYRQNGFIGMIGATNGRLNQSAANTDTNPVFLGKLGYDKQLNEDLRVRLTGSVYASGLTNSMYLYAGDRAGARYYYVMVEDGEDDNFRSGRVNPAMTSQMTSFMINPFVKYKGLEFFGIFEQATGKDSSVDLDNRTWNQYAGEVIYRFGPSEKVFIGARYNMAKGQQAGETTDVSVDRVNVGGGWFLTKNILTKVEYVSQTYHDFTDDNYAGGKFNGVMVEAAIAF